MSVNALSNFSMDNDGSTLHVDCTTMLPANPVLLIFCCPYRLLPKNDIRAGEEVVHGNVLYLDCVPKVFPPTTASGQGFHWDIPNAEYVPNCPDCHLAITELGTPPQVEWTTQVYPCPPLPTPAVHFDGATTFFSAGLACPLSYVMSVSYWYRTQTNESSNYVWLTDTTGELACLEFFSDINKPAILLAEDPYPAHDGGQLQFGSSAEQTFNEWHHVAYRCNSGAGPGAKYAQMLIDGIDVTLKFRDIGNAFVLPFSGFSFAYGSDTYGNGTTFDVAELWFAVGQDVDFGNPDELAKFRSDDGKPVPLGDHGELPTGTPPTIFGHGDKDSFLQPNLGTGGGFALSGALSNAAAPAPGE